MWRENVDENDLKEKEKKLLEKQVTNGYRDLQPIQKTQ